MDETIVGQLGLILSQLRFTRRAVEDIERSTARYGNFAFTQALAQAGRFGEPPMASGALKVYLVNIGDLEPGGGLGGLIEGLMGGFGRFISGLGGGLLAGTVTGILTPLWINDLATVLSSLDRILGRFGIGTDKAPDQKEVPLGETLAQLNTTFRTMTDVIDALTGSKPAQKKAELPAPDKWLMIVQSVERMLPGLGRVVDGLTPLIMIATASLALVVSWLGTIQSTFLDLLQFLLRNIVMLRGVALATMFDTVAGASQLVARLIGLLGTAVGSILKSVFSVMSTVLDVAVEGLKFISGGLQRTLSELLRWSDNIFVLLNQMSKPHIIQLAGHLAEILPAVIVPIYQLKSDKPLSKETLDALDAAAKKTISWNTKAQAGASPSPAWQGPLQLADAMAPADKVKELQSKFTAAAMMVPEEVRKLASTSTGALEDLGKELTKAATEGEASFQKQLDEKIVTVRGRSKDVADAMNKGAEAARNNGNLFPELAQLAKAYESWLAGDGLKMVAAALTTHFAAAPTEAKPGDPRTETARRSMGNPVKAIIDIQDVIIEVAPLAAAAPGSAKPSGAGGAALSRTSQHEDDQDLHERGWHPAPGAIYPQLA